MELLTPNIGIRAFSDKARLCRKWLTGRSFTSGGSTECKSEGLGPRIEEFDLKCTVGDRIGLADQLVEALVGNVAIASGIGVHTMGRAGWLAIQSDAEAYRLAVGPWPQHQMQITGMKAEDDSPPRLVQAGFLFSDGPAPAQAPFVQGQKLRRRVSGGFVVGDRAGDEIVAAAISDISLRRLNGGHVGRRLRPRRSR